MKWYKHAQINQLRQCLFGNFFSPVLDYTIPAKEVHACMGAYFTMVYNMYTLDAFPTNKKLIDNWSSYYSPWHEMQYSSYSRKGTLIDFFGNLY